jgi:hypothetical protein
MRLHRRLIRTPCREMTRRRNAGQDFGGFQQSDREFDGFSAPLAGLWRGKAETFQDGLTPLGTSL